MSNPRVPYRIAFDQPKLPAPEEKPLIVHVVVNVEVWAFDKPVPRTVMTPPQGQSQTPDVPNWSWAEYGNRVGIARIIKMLDDRNLPATCSINSAIISSYPRLAEAIRNVGWEFMGHGVVQRSVKTVPDEAAMIRQALKECGDFTGTPVRGWLGPGLAETVHTPDILKAEGIDYLCDWVLDDLPCWMRTEHGPLICMPYNLELNDSVISAVEKHRSDEMYQRTCLAVECFEPELRERPRVLTLPLHPHLSGVPHRAGWLEKTIDMLLARDDTVFMSGRQIADWYVSVDPAPDTL